MIVCHAICIKIVIGKKEDTIYVLQFIQRNLIMDLWTVFADRCQMNETMNTIYTI